MHTHTGVVAVRFLAGLSGAPGVTGFASWRWAYRPHPSYSRGTSFPVRLNACPHKDKGKLRHGIRECPMAHWGGCSGTPGPPWTCHGAHPWGVLGCTQVLMPLCCASDVRPRVALPADPRQQWAVCMPFDVPAPPTVPGAPETRETCADRWCFPGPRSGRLIRLEVTDELSTSASASSRPWETHKKTIQY